MRPATAGHTFHLWPCVIRCGIEPSIHQARESIRRNHRSVYLLVKSCLPDPMLKNYSRRDGESRSRSNKKRGMP
eukprot:scaffold88018_cov13-Tisochrysis_lutea.AAC.1